MTFGRPYGPPCGSEPQIEIAGILPQKEEIHNKSKDNRGHNQDPDD